MNTIKTLFKVVLALLALRMLIGLVLLGFKVVGLTAGWIEDGLPLPPFRPRDFIIIGLVLILYCLSEIQAYLKRNQDDL